MSIRKESKEAGSKKKVTSSNETIASSKDLQGTSAKEHLGFDTLQVHAGNEKRPGNGPSAPAIYQSASFLFDNAQQGADIFAMKAEGNTYTRLSNPTTEMLERRIAALEGGAAAVAVASGNASQFITFQQLCRPGDTIVSSKSLYGGTFNVFNETYHQLGIECTFVGKDPKEFKNAIKKSTKAVYAETIGNADFFVPDFEALGEICEKAGIPFVVDNTFGGGGYLFRPLEHGANISTDSLTKWIGGHGNSIGGIVVDGGNFDWGNGKFPQIAGPTPSAHGIDFWAKFGKKAFAARAKEIGIRDWGCCISPFNSFLILEGVETLSLRMQREMDNAIELARWLETLPQVESVSYPGLKQHPSHENALKYFKHGFGAVLTFVLKGTREQTAEFVNRLELITHLANVGDNRTLIIQPAGTTHAQLTVDQLHASGLSEGSLRLSVGIEDVEDIKDDIEAALKKF
jgi:O-acetylhomoserine (thiol)-lyase